MGVIHFPPLLTILSRVRCDAMSGNSSSTTSSGLENFVMIVKSRCRGGGHGRGHGHDSGGGRGYGDKGPCQCTHYGRMNYMSDKCWDKFEKSEWAQVIDARLQRLSVMLRFLKYIVAGM